jgi:hypothetical protein
LDREDAPVRDSQSDDSPLAVGKVTAAVAKTDSVLNLSCCVKLQFRHDYQAQPSDTNGMGWNWPRNDESLHNYQGVKVELWDYDPSGGDDFITSGVLYYAADNLYNCFNFTWDQQAQGEDYPDVYIRTEHRVYNTTSLSLKGMNCSDSGCSAGYTWRSSYTENLGQTTSTVSVTLNFGNATGLNNRIAMVMTGVQKALERVNTGISGLQDLKVFYDQGTCGTERIPKYLRRRRRGLEMVEQRP